MGGGETGRKMSKKVVLGVAVILAVVAVAAVVAVLLSGKGEDEVTILTKDRNSSHTAQNESITPTLPQPLPQPLPEQTEPEVFMQTNNSFHGGAVIKANNEFQKVVGYEIIGEDAVEENKTLQMETLAEAIVSGDVLELGGTSFKRHKISQGRPEDQTLPRPGLYASRVGHATTTGWFNDAAEGRKLGSSLGILAFSYQGPMFVGVKLVGDTYVPAGEESTRVNTTDGSAGVKWAHPGYQNPNWKPSRLDGGDEMDQEGHFKIITTVKNKEYFTEFIHLDEMVKVDAGVAVRFSHQPLPLEEEGP